LLLLIRLADIVCLDLLQLLQDVRCHGEGAVERLLDHQDVLLVSEFRFLFLEGLQQVDTVLRLVKIDGEKRYQLVQENVSVGEEAD
jgi:hypothetical protein